VFLGHKAAAAIEVVEHLESPQLDAFVGVMFDYVRPARAVLTTPNAEYNVVWFTLRRHGHRHPDHRFEWSRAEFNTWAAEVGLIHGYELHIEAIGTKHPVWGPPSQVAYSIKGSKRGSGKRRQKPEEGSE
jgi:hypothetical protein